MCPAGAQHTHLPADTPGAPRARPGTHAQPQEDAHAASPSVEPGAEPLNSAWACRNHRCPEPPRRRSARRRGTTQECRFGGRLPPRGRSSSSSHRGTVELEDTGTAETGVGPGPAAQLHTSRKALAFTRPLIYRRAAEPSARQAARTPYPPDRQRNPHLDRRLEPHPPDGQLEPSHLRTGSVEPSSTRRARNLIYGQAAEPSSMDGWLEPLI